MKTSNYRPKRLSAHFSLREFEKSAMAERLLKETGNPAYKNLMTSNCIANAILLCEHVLEPVRNHFGVPIHISSGYRCTALNKAVGGAPKSQHMKGQAADIYINAPPLTLRDIYLWMVDNLSFDQLIRANMFSFCHLFHRFSVTMEPHCALKSAKHLFKN